jgi:WD40 repeat protein
MKNLPHFPFQIYPKLLSAGVPNSTYPNCIAIASIRGHNIIAFGSADYILILSSSFTIQSKLIGHKPLSTVTALSWSSISGLLVSVATDHLIIIWKELENGFNIIQEIQIDFIVWCLSWSPFELFFSAAGSNLVIFRENSGKYQEVYRDTKEADFCSFSGDSRYLVTFKNKCQRLNFYEKKKHNRFSYFSIPLKENLTILSFMWRLHSKLHEHCAFLILNETKTLEIWVEHNTKEDQFLVVDHIDSSYGITSACFLISYSSIFKFVAISELERKNSISEFSDFRNITSPLMKKVPSDNQLFSNVNWILTLTKNNLIIIWELNLRKNPTFSQVSIVNISLKF